MEPRTSQFLPSVLPLNLNPVPSSLSQLTFVSLPSLKWKQWSKHCHLSRSTRGQPTGHSVTREGLWQDSVLLPCDFQHVAWHDGFPTLKWETRTTGEMTGFVSAGEGGAQLGTENKRARARSTQRAEQRCGWTLSLSGTGRDPWEGRLTFR